MPKRMDRHGDAGRLARLVPYLTSPPRVPEGSTTWAGEDERRRRTRNRFQVALERVDQVVEDGDGPWLTRFRRPERQHPTDLDDVLPDDEPAAQDIHAAAPQTPPPPPKPTPRT